METTSSISFLTDLRHWLAFYIDFPGSGIIITLILLTAIAAAAIAGYYITLVILHMVSCVVERTKTTWDDDLLTEHLLRCISQLTPALVVAWMLPQCFATHNTVASTLSILTSFYIIWVSVMIANRFLDNLLSAFAQREKFRAFAVKGIFQMAKLILIGLGVVIALSLLIGKTPVAILTAFGASAAVLMLVFKDTIMGLVASVQLTANKMLRKGDWVVVPRHDANGEVVDISLTTVKIRNWDNSITTVPPYSLVAESFQNYQAMRQSKARRVCRAIYIDMNSVRFLQKEEIDALSTDGLLPAGISSDESRNINLSLFRHAMEHHLAHHPRVRSDLLHMVRQLPPTQSGLPVELYFFLRDTQWKAFEHLQSDIFDYVYAILPRFGLSVFQSPAGSDMENIRKSLSRRPQ